MKPLTKTAILLTLMFLLVTQFSCKQQPSSRNKKSPAPVADVNLPSVDSVFNESVNTGHVAGGVVMMSQNQKTTYWKSFGYSDREAARPMTLDAIFRITFMSAPLTYTALMILYDEGKFALDDPVSKYIPEFKDPRVLKLSDELDTNGIPVSYTLEPATSEISIRHLLTQTSGLTYTFYNHPFLSDMYRQAGISDGLDQRQGTVGDMVKKLGKLPLHFNPGEKWHIGLNADVAGYLVEVLSGQSLKVYLDQHVFQPLGMKDTYFYVPDEKWNRIVSLYQPQEDGSLIKYPPSTQDIHGMILTPSFDPKGPKTYFSGGAGLYSTAADYSRFLQMLLNRGELDGTRILTSETVQLMTTNQLGELVFDMPGLAYGFGFYVQDQPIPVAKASSIGSYSWSGMFNTSFLVDPAMNMCYVVMCQHFPIGQFEVREKVDTQIYRNLLP